MIYQTVKKIIDLFLNEPELMKLNMEFQETISFTEKEYSELTKGFNLVGGEGKTWITSDEFEKRENEKSVVKMTIHYLNEYETLEVYEIDLIRERRWGEEDGS